MNLTNTERNINDYVKGKTWYWYVPLWLFGWYVFVNLVRYDPNKPLPLPIAIAQSFDFFLHEMAHIITSFLPPIVDAASGSLSELLLGSLLVVGALKSRSYMALILCCLWFMLACQSAGTYMADARAQKLSLVSLGAILSGSNEAKHDWNYVFGQLHILRWDIVIGDSVRAVGDVVGLAGLLLGAWIIYKMTAARGNQPALTGKESIMLAEADAEAKRSAKLKAKPGITSSKPDENQSK